MMMMILVLGVLLVFDGQGLRDKRGWRFDIDGNAIKNCWCFFCSE